MPLKDFWAWAGPSESHKNILQAREEGIEMGGKARLFHESSIHFCFSLLARTTGHIATSACKERVVGKYIGVLLLYVF